MNNNCCEHQNRQMKSINAWSFEKSQARLETYYRNLNITFTHNIKMSTIIKLNTV